MGPTATAGASRAPCYRVRRSWTDGTGRRRGTVWRFRHFGGRLGLAVPAAIIWQDALLLPSSWSVGSTVWANNGGMEWRASAGRK